MAAGASFFSSTTSLSISRDDSLGIMAQPLDPASPVPPLAELCLDQVILRTLS